VGKGLTVLIVPPTKNGEPFEEKYTVKAVKAFHEENRILQFWAVSGGLRTIQVDRIVRIGKALRGELQYTQPRRH